MKRKIVFIALALISIISIIFYLEVNVVDKNVPYMPIDYKNVDKVFLFGFSNKTSNDVDIKKIVESINKITKYKQKYKPTNHSTPSPYWSIGIIMNDKNSVEVVKDYDGKIIISNSNKSFIISNDIAQQILNENNLQM